MTSAKILVIGSNSFSGSHFVAEALGAGHLVWGVSRSPEPNPVFLPYRWPQTGGGEALATTENFNFGAIDLNSQLDALLELVDRVQPEIVVNFAAQGMVAESWLNPTHWYRQCGEPGGPSRCIAPATLPCRNTACHYTRGVWQHR